MDAPQFTPYKIAVQRVAPKAAVDELLNGEIFYTLAEAKIVIEQWRRHYNTVRPHSSLGYKPPAPEVVSWPDNSPLVERPMLN